MPHRSILHEIFGRDFRTCKTPEDFKELFFFAPLTLPQLAQLHDSIVKQSSGGIPASVRVTSGKEGAPFAILAMLHGNEPAGLAAFALAMALGEMGALSRDIICVIGNPLASAQYFEAYANAPNAHQATRDGYRCGIDDAGNLLPDMNRIPVDFLTRSEVTPHIQRARELHAMAQNIWGLTDIHSARGNMVCFTDFKHASDLRYSPLRKVLVGLSEAIGAHASAAVNVQTFKTILAPMKHIHSHTGIEAGTHEDAQAPMVAASFTLSLLYNLGITHIAPYFTDENGVFEKFTVRPRITYADLIPDAPLPASDMVFMAREVQGKVQHSQYEEMEAVVRGQVVAVAEPSGITLRAPSNFSGIFISKAGALYDKDPAVGPWPLPVSAMHRTKFCYPCDVSAWQVEWED